MRDMGITSVQVSNRVRSHVIAVLLAASLASASVTPAFASEEHRFDVPATEPRAAIRKFAAQAKVQILAAGENVEQAKLNPVSGQLSTEEGLKILLARSGLQARYVGERSIALVKEGSADHGAERFTNIAAVTLDASGASESNATSGDAQDAESTDPSKSGKKPNQQVEEVIVTGRLLDPVSMMKRGETLRETPQAVTIMTQQRIQEQKLTSISEVMGQAPGMTVERDYYGRPAAFYSRGFAISNMQIDGVSAGVNSSTQSNRNLAMYEQVEILRGADGLFAGSGDPGGTVNLARKRGLDHSQILFNTSAGRWNNFQADLDVTGPLAFDGRLRSRAVAQWHDRDYFYDTAKSSGWFFYATAEMDITDSTLLVIGGDLGKSDDVPMIRGVPRYETGEVLPGWTRERSYVVSSWNTWKQEPSEVFGRLEQKIGDNWRLTLSAASEDVDFFTNYMFGYNVSHITGHTGVYQAGYDVASGTDSFDINIQGKFNLLGRTHSVLLGYDRYKRGVHEDGIGASWIVPPPETMDPFDFRADSIPAPDNLARTYKAVTSTQQHGMYGRVQLHLAEPFKLILGGRYSSYENKVDVWSRNADGSVAAFPNSSSRNEVSNKFTPYASALFDLNRQWTLYANVTEIFKAQGNLLGGPPPGTPLEPLTGRSYEFGSKGELSDGRLGVSAALYYIEQTGRGERDPSSPVSGSACCYVALGKVVSQGIDTEVSGEIRPGWSVFGGYTFNDNEDKRSGSLLQTLSPKHTFKLWTSYKIPAAQQKWLVGSGVTVQSRRFQAGMVATYNSDSGDYDGPPEYFEWAQGGYAVWNAMAQYRLSPNWQLSLNANNLLDKTYFSGLAYYSSFYGEPRNFILTVRGRF